MLAPLQNHWGGGGGAAPPPPFSLRLCKGHRLFTSVNIVSIVNKDIFEVKSNFIRLRPRVCFIQSFPILRLLYTKYRKILITPV